MNSTAHTGPGHDAGDPGFCEGCLPVTAPEVPATNDPTKCATCGEPMLPSRYFDELGKECGNCGRFDSPVLFSAQNIINQIGDLWSERMPSPHWVPVRQATNDELDRFVSAIIATELQKARAEGNHAATIAQLHDIAATTNLSLSMVMEAAGIFAEVESLRAKLAAVEAWQQSWSDSEDRLLLLPEASAELVAILRSREPSTA